ncbi:MAG: cation diffusion facilitator family transporter, partial [Chlamydiales bacterium]
WYSVHVTVLVLAFRMYVLSLFFFCVVLTFFSAGFEGGMIFIVALYIFYQAVFRLFKVVEIAHVEEGIWLTSLTFLINGLLGLYLIREGKRSYSLILEANGRHLFTDCLTSGFVILALLLARWTGWSYFDPLLAIVVAINILWTGARLLNNAIHGLMDRSDPKLDKKIRLFLERAAHQYGIKYHCLRHRNAGNRLLVEVHLLFPKELKIHEAHEIATLIEKDLQGDTSQPIEFVSHLEPIEGHDKIHREVLGYDG